MHMGMVDKTINTSFPGYNVEWYFHYNTSIGFRRIYNANQDPHITTGACPHDQQRRQRLVCLLSPPLQTRSVVQTLPPCCR